MDEQREIIVKEEVAAIRAACLTLDPSYNPTITYLVIQKRHHTRFFPIYQEDMDKSGNILPGTVVDSGITHPTDLDFYLCSHPGLQGTSKPAYYHVVHDENNIPGDVLQDLTYRLCFLYCRATRSVSVCPPAYYAHLVATRARFHVQAAESEQSKHGDRSYEGVIGGMAGLDIGRSSSTNSLVDLGRHAEGKRGREERSSLHSSVRPELSRVMYFM